MGRACRQFSLEALQQVQTAVSEAPPLLGQGLQPQGNARSGPRLATGEGGVLK